MHRRRFLEVTAAALAASVLGSRRSSARPAGDSVPEMKPGSTENPGGLAKLPEWASGDCSCSDSAVLMFRGNPAHTFYGTGPVRDALEVAWRFRTQDFVTELRGESKTWSGTGWTGQASCLGDYVFFGSQDRHLYCLDARDGKLVWRYRGARMFKGSLCIYRNRVYAPNVDDHLHCLDAADGRLLWRHDTGKDLDSSPCVWKGKLFIAGENGHVRCLDPEDGTLQWKTLVGGIGPGTKAGSNGAEGSPAVDNHQVVVGNYDGEVHCLDARDGKRLWKAKTGDDTDVSAVFSSDRVYIAAEEGAPSIFCFDRENGAEVWTFSNRGGWYSTPALVGERLYIGGNDGRFYCIEARSGKLVWEVPIEAATWCSPAVVDGKVMFGSYGNHFCVLDAVDGREIAKIDLGGRIHSAPCVVGGRVYVGTAAGWFNCLA